MIYYIIGLAVVCVLLGYIALNLLKKNEKQEDILATYLTYLQNLSKVIEIADKRLSDVDTKGAFESDDEIGFFFKEIKQVQEILNDFQLKETK